MGLATLFCCELAVGLGWTGGRKLGGKRRGVLEALIADLALFGLGAASSHRHRVQTG